MKIIEISGLQFAYPNGRKALGGVELVVERGESLALIGPNGSGKSTLLLHLNGILVGSGDIKIFGLPVGKKNLAEIRKRVGVVFQDPDDQLFSPTVFDDVAFGPINLGLKKEEVGKRVYEALTKVGLRNLAEESPQHLSFGEKKRVSVATVLSMEPELLVLDEPTSNLDPKSRRELLELFKELEGTKIIATHDLQAVDELATRVAILHEGKIAADGDKSEILKDSALLKEFDLY
ncbi:MAG: ABC transporter ATP-binding protein [Candidatus Altiarchaeota archaeon]|nr:ABC transporter ATP-binding protein [Candidatus Altiarchaeota archaeon]